MTPRATIRLQFHAQFTFDHARSLVPYFAKLGISHIYASPIMAARPESKHGYDAVDPTVVSPALGGEEGLAALVMELRKHQMGVVLDIVPNHLGVGGDDNAWWNHVLAFGNGSPFAKFFDINWNSRHCPGKLLLPILGKPLGEEISARSLRLVADTENKALALVYGDRRLPLAPASYGLALGLDEPTHNPDAFSNWCGAIDAEKLHIAVQRHDPTSAAGRTRLLALLDLQHYRLAWWRVAADEINWRRFFEINELAGLRMDHAPAFDAVHALIFRLYARGMIDGVRIDHIDGLANPRAYGRKLRRRLRDLTSQRPSHLRGEPWIIAEKILAPDETMPPDWQMDGTSGYDFMTEVNRLLHDERGEAALTQIWRSFSGRIADFDSEQQTARREIATAGFHGHWQELSSDLQAIASATPETRDYAHHMISEALLRIVAAMQVYRIYAGAGGISASDEKHFHSAVRRAKKARPHWLRPVIDKVAQWLTESPRRATGDQRRLRACAMRKFQHLTAPVAAKAVEDTAFYRYGAMISLNEVGGDPGLFSLPVEDFHQRMQWRANHAPHGMLSTATHDHKRGEDTRARISVISEIPDEWQRAVDAMRLASELDGNAGLDSGHIYMLWQTIVGAWPLDLLPDDSAGMDQFIKRLLEWQQKAMREAKLMTSWAEPNEEVEERHALFLRKLLSDESAFQKLAFELSQRIRPIGAIKSLSQCVARLTAPGIPDLYQGTEFWDFSLVDPDNRAAVDYSARLDAIQQHKDIPGLSSSWRDGRIKQAIVAKLLALRSRAPTLFTSGDYMPLTLEGPLADAFVGFIRRNDDQALVTIFPRLAARLRPDPATLSVPVDVWHGLSVEWPGWIEDHRWRDAFNERTVRPAAALRPETARLPVVLLVSNA